MNKKSIEDIVLDNKKIVLRVDFNVPIKNGVIMNSYRIDNSLKTINYCIKNNAKKIIIISHLGRPNGKFNESLTLLPVKEYLENKLIEKIDFCSLNNINGKNRIVLVENIRFYKSETNKFLDDKTIKFRNKLSSLGDIFINDAFGCCHRNHSSIVGVDCKKKVSGFLLKNEINYLSNVIDNPNKKFVAIVGGSKVSDKIKLLNNLIPKIDELIIGGAMAFTFLKKFNYKIGKSIFDKDGYDLIDDIYDTAKNNNVNIHLQIDTVISSEFSNSSNFSVIEGDIPDGYMGLDIGPKTIEKFSKVIKNAKTILWNGPVGVFEFSNFSNGSRQIAESIKYATKNNNAISIVGGGDTASCVINFGYQNDISHISTGGGASLELLEGKKLPGLEILDSM